MRAFAVTPRRPLPDQEPGWLYDVDTILYEKEMKKAWQLCKRMQSRAVDALANRHLPQQHMKLSVFA